MLDFKSNKDLLTTENEIKPNIYTARALQVAIAALVLSLLFNEMDLFHVDKRIMRGCCAVSIMCALVPQMLAYNKKIVCKTSCKYWILLCVCVMNFVLELTLFVFTAPICMLPMLLSVQYNSKRFSKIAIIGTGVSIALTPPLGCLFGLWDDGFLQYLISCILKSEVYLTPTVGISAFTVVWSSSLYISFPWLMCVVMFGRLILSISAKGEEGIKNQIIMLNMSRRDNLTGLYSQNFYKELLNEDMGTGSMGVIFFDVNGLKEANDKYGHDYGDTLLRQCAASLKPLFDDNCYGFRIGGDEFLVLIDTDNPDDVDGKLHRWEKEMARINLENKMSFDNVSCHMSAGTAFGDKSELFDLINEADKNMYEAKQKYYSRA